VNIKGFVERQIDGHEALFRQRFVD
jgi:hypothetical protein